MNLARKRATHSADFVQAAVANTDTARKVALRARAAKLAFVSSGRRSPCAPCRSGRSPAAALRGPPQDGPRDRSPELASGRAIDFLGLRLDRSEVPSQRAGGSAQVAKQGLET